MPDLKDKLAAVEVDLTSLRDKKKAAVEARDEAKRAIAGMDRVDRESDEYKAAMATVDEVRNIEAQIVEKQAEQVDYLRMLGADDPDPAQPAKASGASKARADVWDSARVVESAAYEELCRDPALYSEKSRIGNKVLGEIVNRDGLRAELGTADVAGLIQPDQRGLILPSYRPLTLLDLIPSGTTNSNSIEYVQATTRASRADVVAEGALKPEQSLAFADRDAPIRTIAGWIKVRKQTLDDAAGLRTYIDTELRYDVRRELEAQVIGGDGTGQNLTGILNMTGVQEPTVTGYRSYADRIHGGITALYKANYIPDAVVVHPDDWEVIRLSRDDSGAGAGTGGYLFGLPAYPGLPTLWGLTPIISQAIPRGTALVGSFRQGAVIMYRQGIVVLVSDSDQDDFVRNRVTILAELRAGLPVFRPDAYAIIDLDAV